MDFMYEIDGQPDGLLVVTPDGDYRYVPNTYDDIHAAIDARWGAIDFAGAGPRTPGGERPNVGCYVSDEGLLDGLLLNIPASMVIGQPLYGVAVFAAALTGPEGDSLPMGMSDVLDVVATATRWQVVRKGCERLFQPWAIYPAPDDLPPPTVTPLYVRPH